MTHTKAYVESLIGAIQGLDLDAVQQWIDRIVQARDDAATIFVCGNGGSAATASHFATDLGKGASFRQPKRFRVVALTDSISTISAYANDVGFEVVFAEQLRGLGRPSDVLVTISGSGTSPNVLRAIEVARELHMDVVSLTGFAGGESGALSDIHVNVPSNHMGRIEDVHMALCHMVAFSFIAPDDHSVH